MSRKSNSSSSKSSRIRKHRDDTFKIKVVLESLKETMTMAELASKYEVLPKPDPDMEKAVSGKGRKRI